MHRKCDGTFNNYPLGLSRFKIALLWKLNEITVCSINLQNISITNRNIPLPIFHQTFETKSSSCNGENRVINGMSMLLYLCVSFLCRSYHTSPSIVNFCWMFNTCEMLYLLFTGYWNFETNIFSGKPSASLLGSPNVRKRLHGIAGSAFRTAGSASPACALPKAKDGRSDPHLIFMLCFTW